MAVICFFYNCLELWSTKKLGEDLLLLPSGFLWVFFHLVLLCCFALYHQCFQTRQKRNAT